MFDENQNTVATINKKYNEFNVMQIRLDTSQITAEIEKYLRGSTYIAMEDENGNIIQKRLNFGVKKANEEGIQSIINWISIHANPQTVQGNFMKTGSISEDFENFMCFFQYHLGIYLMDNLYEFEISEKEYTGIIQCTRGYVERFLSRCINNLERESYGDTTRSIESNTIAQKGGFNLFGKKE